MKVAHLLESRRTNWRELERLCLQLETRSKQALDPRQVARFAALYRAASADLALADAYQLPPNTIDYLHQLVGRAHNQMYRSRGFTMGAWAREMLFELPQRMFQDNALRLAAALFWGFFLASMFSAYVSPQFSETLLGKEQMQGLEEMYSEPASGYVGDRSTYAGFYVFHNAGIGLQCFAAGLLAGVGGLFITISNASILGASFGHMLTTPHRDNFYHFVTAHGPFELTAIVLASAAGMRIGFSMIDTRGLTRSASLRRATREVVPLASLSVILFCLAAGIEAFISPSILPYAIKALVAVASAGLLMFYFIMLGYPLENRAPLAAEAPPQVAPVK